MNHIKRLQKESIEARILIAGLEGEMARFQVYLTSSKFEGELDDYIRTWEVTSFMNRLGTLILKFEDSQSL
jgi:hypothetical protein